MADQELTAVASVVGASGGKPGRCFASVTGPEADNTRGPAIALETMRSTINALRTAHTTAKKTAAFTLAELVVTVGVLVLLVLLAT
ncbi:MAG TPA: hypothetical protein VFX07_12800, partial [Candidatus Udaeobacter sp.]|nr:hypothetical protein [Candidatus Udaeobacter sp.]